MNRKQIIEKQKALASITQSKTGDAILRKNVFELRVLKTKLTELETEEKRWKTHHSYDVKEAKKEARTRQMAKLATFKRVAHVALATQRLKMLAPFVESKKEQVEDIEQQSAKDILQDNETVNTSLSKTSSPKKIRYPTAPETCLPPLSSRICHINRQLSSSYPERTTNYSSPLLIRRKVDGWTGKPRITAETSTIVRDIVNQSASPRSCTMSPMLDKRFLGLQAALVPLHHGDDSDNEHEDQKKQNDSSSDDDGFDSILL